ncbi:hypothetical protein M0R45_002242 [Rubus argutus]|uniref:Uncharacterized protein n=1 Tax=Rubus argutus TaxID=59490 RepID=A0AAW1VJM2_RUBAR
MISSCPEILSHLVNRNNTDSRNPVHIFYPPRAQPRRANLFSRRRSSQVSAETSLRLLLTLTAIHPVLKPASAQPSVRASPTPSLSSQPRRRICPSRSD